MYERGRRHSTHHHDEEKDDAAGPASEDEEDEGVADHDPTVATVAALLPGGGVVKSPSPAPPSELGAGDGPPELNLVLMTDVDGANDTQMIRLSPERDQDYSPSDPGMIGVMAVEARRPRSGQL